MTADILIASGVIALIAAFVGVMIAAHRNPDKHEALDGPGTWGAE